MSLISQVIKKFKGEKEGKIIKEWDFLADDIITTNPAISKDNSLIIFGTKNGKIYALDLEGKLIWRKHLSGIKTKMLFFMNSKKGHGFHSTLNKFAIRFTLNICV
ncbi:MAG: PQQ-binding-like beta-propeller repeat protein [Nanoarchaeota archaeon]|nr:PQQ-binding-like beta-propeller repeat protein [Nanoarchaeota archaeon]